MIIKLERSAEKVELKFNEEKKAYMVVKSKELFSSVFSLIIGNYN